MGDVSLAVLARKLAALVAPADTLTAALGYRTTGLVGADGDVGAVAGAQRLVDVEPS